MSCVFVTVMMVVVFVFESVRDDGGVDSYGSRQSHEFRWAG